MKDGTFPNYERGSQRRRSPRRPGDFRKRLKDPLTIQNVLTSALKKSGLDKDIARYNFVLHWEEIVGAEIAKRTKPECIRSGALVIRVVNSVWAQELTFQQEVILRRLQRFLGDKEQVNEVRFYVGEI